MNPQQEIELKVWQTRENLKIQNIREADSVWDSNTEQYKTKKIYDLGQGVSVPEKKYPQHCQMVWRKLKCHWLNYGFLDSRGIRHRVGNLDPATDKVCNPILQGIIPIIGVQVKETTYLVNKIIAHPQCPFNLAHELDCIHHISESHLVSSLSKSSQNDFQKMKALIFT